MADQKPPSLPYPDHLHFEAAQGWLMLGDAASAIEELGKLTVESREVPDVRELEWEIHAKRGAWGTAYELARTLVERAPDRVFGWIHRAYALRRMEGGGVPQAWEALLPAFEKFPKQYLIAYNLACYAVQLGRPDEGWEWLRRALAASGNRERIRRMALGDADLEPLWPRVQKEL